jgi:hypothetical protein
MKLVMFSVPQPVSSWRGISCYINKIILRANARLCKVEKDE